MDKAKQINELTVEELLEQAEINVPEAEKPAADLDLDDTARFFATYNIKGGPQKVRRRFFYEWYTRWSKNPVSSVQFHKEADRFFENNSQHYYLNKKAFEVVEKIKKLMETSKKNVTVTYKVKNHIEWFLTANNIRKGDLWIRHSILYQLYKTWCLKNGYRIRFKQTRFGNMCKPLFITKVVQRELNFRVSSTIIQHLSEELLEKVNKNEKNKKKPTKVPSIEQGVQPEEPSGSQ